YRELANCKSRTSLRTWHRYRLCAYEGASAKEAGRRISHRRSNSAGAQNSVHTTKNGTQPIASANAPPDADSTLSPTVASDDSSAYCVAVKSRLHKFERYATKAEDAMPPVTFSAAIVTVSTPTSCPAQNCTAYIRFDSACNPPPTSSARNTPTLATSTPPSATPTRAAMTP